MIERGIDKTTSHLLVQKASAKDSGTYKCSPLNTVEASINIHVLRGEHFAIPFFSLHHHQATIQQEVKSQADR